MYVMSTTGSNTLGRNIRTIRTKLGMNIEQLALKADFDSSNLSKIERGLGGYSKQGLERLAKALGVSLGALFAEEPHEAFVLTGTRKVPILDDYQARSFVAGEEITPHLSEVGTSILMDIKDSARLFGHHVKGDSMLPEFKNGDLIVVDPDGTPEPGDFVLIDRYQEGLLVRQYRVRGYNRAGAPILELAALNPAFPSFNSEFVDIVLIGTVVEQRKRWK